MNKKQQRVADVKFIFAECERLRKEVGVSGMRGLTLTVALNHLPHPSGKGGQLCTEEGWERIEKLALEAGHAAQLKSRVQLETLKTPLAEELVRRFQREKKPISWQEVDRAFSAVARTARSACSDAIHFVPCHLMWADEPNQIAFGPITFLSRTAFRKRILKETKAFRLSGKNASARTLYRKLLREALHYYRSFKWVAEVQIRRCDKKRSAELAEAAVSSALDCLHLLFGASHTSKMRIGGPRLNIDKRATMHISASGKLSPSLSSGGPGQVGFRKGWSAVLETDRYKNCVALIAVALEASVDPDIDRPLSRRFLDAAAWFGEGVREQSPAAATIKFVTALERMVMTDEKDDILSVVSARVAALCSASSHADSRAQWHKDAREAYDMRSKLVHGALSPNDSGIYRGRRLGARLGAATLLNALFTFGEAGLRDKNATTRKLAAHYSSIVTRL